MAVNQCPSCGYERQPHDGHIHAGICPSCGIAYAKYLNKRVSEEKVPEQPGRDTDAITPDDDFIVAEHSLRERLRETVLAHPEPVDQTRLIFQLLLSALSVVWGLYFIAGGVDWEHVGSSFLHNCNLPFHEFGHLLFSPFGRFMSILGGSLFQVLLPLLLMAAFVVQRGDNHAGSIMLWWSGQNFIDVAPYIKDAPYRALPLIRGMDESAHDWGNLLGSMNALDSAAALASTSFMLGAGLMGLSWYWGWRLLWPQYQSLRP